MNHCNYTERDMRILSEIHEFLVENEIDYSSEYDNFCLHFGNPDGKRSYEITYVSSEEFPIAYPKYGIDGVQQDFFYKLSYKAEHEDNSFRCWVKDYEWEDPRKREVLKSYFLYAAGKVKNKFYARDCEVFEVPVEKLKFYSDYDHNIGGSMEQLGFNFVSYSKGGFMNLWLETGEVKHREPGRHGLIMEKMKEGSLIAIPNAGVKTFELIPDRELFPVPELVLEKEW